eukprot:s956_g3.t1
MPLLILLLLLLVVVVLVLVLVLVLVTPMTRITLLMLLGTASAFVAPPARPAGITAPVAVSEATQNVEEAASWSSPLLAGLSMGYAAAAGMAFRRGKTSCKAEQTPAVARTPVAYPIFTFRWLAVHALVVPTVFFLALSRVAKILQTELPLESRAFLTPTHSEGQSLAPKLGYASWQNFLERITTEQQRQIPTDSDR